MIVLNGIGDIRLFVGSVINVFDGVIGNVDLLIKVIYKNEYVFLVVVFIVVDYFGYFFIVDGDDKLYVNMNIIIGGVGDIRVFLLI